MLSSSQKYQFWLVIAIFVVVAIAKKSDDESKPAWAKKKITDYTDADMERLLDQWNVSWWKMTQFQLECYRWSYSAGGRRRWGSGWFTGAFASVSTDRYVKGGHEQSGKFVETVEKGQNSHDICHRVWQSNEIGRGRDYENMANRTVE